MRTLRETEQIELYLLGKMKPATKLVFEARLLIDPVLKFHVQCQQKVYAILKKSGRRHLKSEIERVHRQLFDDVSKKEFQQNVYKLFLKG